MNGEELARRLPMGAEYLIQMFLIERDYRVINNARLAERIKVSRAAVSQALSRLKHAGLAEEESSEGYRLSAEGRELAALFLKRHYLVEHLLVRKLDFPWDLADDEAMRLQDKISDAFAAHLEAYLGHPDTCPHGNPFPGSANEARLLGARSLVQLESGGIVRLLRITEEGEAVPGLLSACFAHRLQPGRVFVMRLLPGSDVELKDPEGGEAFILQQDYARHLRAETA